MTLLKSALCTKSIFRTQLEGTSSLQKNSFLKVPRNIEEGAFLTKLTKRLKSRSCHFFGTKKSNGSDRPRVYYFEMGGDKNHDL